MLGDVGERRDMRCNDHSRICPKARVRRALEFAVVDVQRDAA